MFMTLWKRFIKSGRRDDEALTCITTGKIKVSTLQISFRARGFQYVAPCVK